MYRSGGRSACDPKWWTERAKCHIEKWPRPTAGALKCGKLDDSACARDMHGAIQRGRGREKEGDAGKTRKRCKIGGEIGDIDEERENDENNKDNKTKKN